MTGGDRGLRPARGCARTGPWPARGCAVERRVPGARLAREAERLFEVIRDEAVKISRATRAPLDDVEQEMRVMCLEVALGISRYDDRRGPLRPWLIVRAWRTARRWNRGSVGLEDFAAFESYPQEQVSLPPAMCASEDRLFATGTDETLMADDERHARERAIERGGEVPTWSEIVAVRRLMRRYARANKIALGERRGIERVREALSSVLKSSMRPCTGATADPRTTFEILATEHWSERDAVKWCGGSRKVARLAKRRAERIQAAGLPHSDGDHHATVR